MLTGDLVRATFRSGKVRPRYLDVESETLEGETRELIALFEAHAGRTIGALEEAIADHIGDGTDFSIRRGLVKLLMDASTVEMVAPRAPTEIRRQVFEAAAAQWPVSADPTRGSARDEALSVAAEALGLTVAQVEEGLYADLKLEHRLIAADLPEPKALVKRYNLSLAQAVVLRAHELVITLPSPSPAQTRAIVRAMKFRQLLHRIERDGKKLVLRLDGPLSIFRQTQRYGLQLALFIPTLLSCDRFELEAIVTWGKERRPGTFSLSHADGLEAPKRGKGMWVSAEEKTLRAQWKKLDTPWTLERSTRIVDLDGRGLLVPDYIVRHPDGRQGLVEIVWSWRRSTFERRLALLQQSAPPNLIVVLSLRRHVGEEERPSLPTGTIVPFKGVISPKRIIEAAERVAR